ncbi:MAG TPA: hypothetical protein VG327_08885, partial [Mycobacterium sp.]|nr:hypothetical protein [Mycobacterium sp.]
MTANLPKTATCFRGSKWRLIGRLRGLPHGTNLRLPWRLLHWHLLRRRWDLLQRCLLQWGLLRWRLLQRRPLAWQLLG